MTGAAADPFTDTDLDGDDTDADGDLADAIGDDAGNAEAPRESTVTTDPPDGSTLDLAPGEEAVERTGRWRGVQALALVGTALGIVLGAPLVIVTGVVGVGFAAYARAWDAPAPALAVERAVSDPDPRPGDRVRVTLSVRNRGDRLLPDVRLCDDVPAGLRVVEGTPRHTTALRPGKTATVAYEVEAVRGEHAFDSLTVVTRDLSGSSRRIARLPTPDETVTCRPAFGERSASLGDLATLLAGRTAVAETGSGTAFHSLREYRSGDPLGKLDWSHLAKTGEFATRRFDEPRLVRVVVLVDARRAAYVTNDENRRRPAVDVCAHAAGALVAGLLDDGALVGLGAVSPRTCWVPTANGRAHRERLLRTLVSHEAFDWNPPTAAGVATDARDRSTADPTPTVASDRARLARSTAAEEDGGAVTAASGAGGRPLVASDGGTERPVAGNAGTGRTETGGADGAEGTERPPDPDDRASAVLDDVASRIPGDAQVVFASPLVDDVAASVAVRLDARGHDVLVASPDLTGRDTPYRRLAGAERRLRLDRLRRSGIPVHDWTPPSDPTADAGWSS